MKKINIFIGLIQGILFKPRQTIRTILPLGFQYGIVTFLLVDSFLEIIQHHHVKIPGLESRKYFFDFLIFFLFGAFKYSLWWITAYLIFWLGKIFNGIASVKELFGTVIWTAVPDIIGKLFFVLAGVLLANSNQDAVPEPYLFISQLLQFFAFCMAIWGMVISIIVYSEVQKISILKSTAVNLIFSGMMFGVYVLSGESPLHVLEGFFTY